MKRYVFGILILALAACGDDDNGEKSPRRIADPAALLVGPVGGSERLTFSDGSRLNFIVSGIMAVRTPAGVFLGTAFPAEVTFSVRSVTGATLSNAVEFPRLQISEGGSFQGDVSTATSRASIAGMFRRVTGTTLLDVQAFSYALPATNPNVRERALLLQGSSLRERDVEALP